MLPPCDKFHGCPLSCEDKLVAETNPVGHTGEPAQDAAAAPVAASAAAATAAEAEAAATAAEAEDAAARLQPQLDCTIRKHQQHRLVLVATQPVLIVLDHLQQQLSLKSTFSLLWQTWVTRGQVFFGINMKVKRMQSRHQFGLIDGCGFVRHQPV